MRGESEFAEQERRPGADLLQRDTIKVINMLDLARELSGEPTAPFSTAQHPDPSEFWKRAFLDWRGATPLVSTVPPPQVAARKPAQQSLTFNEAVSDELRTFADQIGVPFSVLFHASWALLLHRYSGEDDVVFGVVKGCIEREAPEIEPAIHIVPSRIIFDSDTVRHWLRALADQVKETAPFEFISLDQIRAAANVPAETAMFESVLGVGHEAFDPLSIATAQPQATQRRAGADTYPLVAAVYFSREITLRVAYSPLRFSETAIRLLLGHWRTLLTNLKRCVERPVASVSMITPAERVQLLQEWNATESSWPSHACVHQLFEQQVERTPDAVAVKFGSEELSYRELNYRANALAHHLRSRGIGPDSVVGICVERSFDMAVSVLGALKAGAAYLPLDPAYPHERLQFMVEDSHAAVLLTQSKLRHVFPNLTTPALLLDEDWSAGAKVNRENPENLTGPENLSYLIYTSGSTGKPKGVAMVHRALVNLLDWQARDSRAGAGTKTLQFTSLSFDVSFQEIFSTWSTGGTLVLIAAELRLSPRELWSFIVREEIARIFLPFVALQQLADAAAAEGSVADALREVITAGEQLQVTPKLRELFTRHPEATLHNHYGPSETHVVTALAMSGDPQQWSALPSIGRPIQNTQIYLLDKNHEPSPIGLPGELYIGGVALARGYFERPKVTAEKFVDNPLPDVAPHTSSSGSGRLYKTGDLARWLPNGEIEFLGRIDHQVKIRGYRVELGEIEAALGKLPAVRESVVVAREHLPGQKQLVAYVVRHGQAELNAAALRHELKQHLPDYMVPAAFVFLEKLPLTPSGKVDRKSLPAPEQQPATPATPVNLNERPWLPIQFQLVQIWEEILGVKPVGIRDNFFELGGHSLLAVRMMDRVEEVTGRKLPVTALFADATITHLAELLLNEETGVPAPVIEVQAGGDRLPLYFLHGDIIGGGFYARDISRLLGEQQSFYVLPPVEIPDSTPPPSVEDMATQHLRDLRAHRPHGPYLLGGFCIGGLIAYEMARRLKAAGEEVPCVAMIDPELPGAFLRANLHLVQWISKKRALSARETTRLFARGHKLLYRLREEWNAPFRDKARFAFRKTRRLFGGNGHSPAPANETAEESPVDDQDILATFQWILSSYVPPPYDGAVAVFLTEEQESFAPFLRRKWRKSAPRAEVHSIAGKHLGAITTNVEVLSAKMCECLQRVNGQAS
jgi:amino acid adenylation domain-containing protein